MMAETVDSIERVKQQARHRARRYYRRMATDPAFRAKRARKQREARVSRKQKALREIGRIRTIRDLKAVLAKHRIALGLTQIELDNIIGWTDGYTSKLEIGSDPKRDDGTRGTARLPGNMSFELWLLGLGVELVLVPRDDKRQNKDVT